jgi:hypothetical protein
MKYLQVLLFFCLPYIVNAQVKSNAQIKSSRDEVYIDTKGTLRLTKNGSEANYFGVNYTLPFAYAYRSHKHLNIDLEKAIDQDVYHLARLGINAFRVHVFDTEISDSLGNLKENEHLRLFDYLLSKLEARNIRIIITPIAFWGNGYPDADEKTGSFVEKYGKNGCVVTPAAFLAQENYLKQFFRHVNPYTHKTYTDDYFVIATEVNNEPHHTGPQTLATTYINRMIKAIKSTGWTKPVFYNISESPTYANAVAKSDANGFSFQWYPTGLVAGHAQRGNVLPNVDQYVIPFDTIPEFRNKPRMVYEFESADVMDPYMYPAMARSFKTAGFQWATQFAYDPMGTAYANTEYQTHYLNLAYTPSKAVSLLIAAQVFKFVPLFKSYGAFPADTTFGPFKVSYKMHTTEMNTDTAFYYANGSSATPINAKALKHIAGVGSSHLVHYSGSGAYFLDKLNAGCWRLEVMPDALVLKDPFGKNELDKPVTKIVYGHRKMQVQLPDLSANFKITALNVGNSYSSKVVQGGFDIRPGTYLLQNSAASKATLPRRLGVIGLNEFVAPADNPFNSADVAKNNAKQPSLDNLSKQLVLFGAGTDLASLQVYASEWQSDPYYFKIDSSGTNFLNLQHKASKNGIMGGMQVFVKDKLGSRNLDAFDSVTITANTSRDLQAKITLIDEDANAFSATVRLQKGKRILSIPLSAFRPDGYLLLPRPYPGFQSLTFKRSGTSLLKLKKLDKVQFMPQGNSTDPYAIDIYSIGLASRKAISQ